MLNHTQATEIIKLMQADLLATGSAAKKPNQVYRELYQYLNYAGGRTLIPAELKSYKNTLAIFQNPQQVLATIQPESPGNNQPQIKKMHKEIQTIALLWLRAASATLSQDVDLNIIIKEYYTNSRH